MNEDFKGFLYFATLVFGMTIVVTSGCTAYNFMSFREQERQQTAEAEYRKWMVEQGMVETIEATPGEPIVTKVWKKAGE